MHKLSVAIVSVVSASLALVLSACGAAPSNDSDALVARDAETQFTSPAPVLAFVAAAKAVLAAPTHVGTIPATTFVNLIPLSNADRAALQAAYPGNFQVSCSGAKCTAKASGVVTQATLLASVNINFFVTITDPRLDVANQITTNFVLRGDKGVEFCNLTGLGVTKSGFAKTLHGLYDRVESGQARLTVGDEINDFTCAL